MNQEAVKVYDHQSEIIGDGNLILSIRYTPGTKCALVIGSPSLPNVIEEMRIGDAVLFETPTDGVFDIR